jgi:GAF domain-containing protein
VDARAILAETFVELADTLVDDFDLIDFLDRLCGRCVELFSVDAAGLMLRDHRGDLRVLAASSEETRLVELFQIQDSEGPCLDCNRAGRQVHADDAAEIERRWPHFGTRVAGQFASVYALPMRLRSDVIGGLNLFGRHDHALDPDDIRIAQALADTATIGIIQQRALREQTVLSEQLQHALNSRVLIEQAKGIYAERHHVDMGAAWEALRHHSRNNNLPLHAVAAGYVDGTIELDTVR